MSLNNLDLENKLFIPSKQLLAKVNNDLSELYDETRQALIDAHSFIATEGIKLYEQPAETASLWYGQSGAFISDVSTQVKTQAQAGYQTIDAGFLQFNVAVSEGFNTLISNPGQVTAEMIASIQNTVTNSINLGSDLAGQLQASAGKIIDLLIASPMQTLETAFYDSLAAMLNGYFALVSSALTIL